MTRIVLEHGVTIEPSVQDDIDSVEANFRVGDRREHEALGGRRTLIESFVQCWTIRIRDAIVGYCGVALFPGETRFSPRRILCFMSCENANRAKVAFVRMSRRTLAEIAGRCEPWVEEFHSAPDVEYTGSLIWHERVLKMHRVGDLRYRGRILRHYSISRKELV